jgi:hypothetical protein
MQIDSQNNSVRTSNDADTRAHDTYFGVAVLMMKQNGGRQLPDLELALQANKRADEVLRLKKVLDKAEAEQAAMAQTEDDADDYKVPDWD